jgi:hypothetical protein
MSADAQDQELSVVGGVGQFRPRISAANAGT